MMLTYFVTSFTKYEMHQKLSASKSENGEGSLDVNVALFTKKRDLSDVTCYGYGKKVQFQQYCQEKKDEKLKSEKLKPEKPEKPKTQGKMSTSKANKVDIRNLFVKGHLHHHCKCLST